MKKLSKFFEGFFINENMITSKYKFTERFFNNDDESINKGILTIEHNLTEKELNDVLNENGLFLDDVDGIFYFDIEWVNENYDITFEKIN